MKTVSVSHAVAVVLISFASVSSAFACGYPTPPPRVTAGPAIYTVSLTDGTVITCVKSTTAVTPGLSVEKNGGTYFEALTVRISAYTSQFKKLSQQLKQKKRTHKPIASLQKKIAALQNQMASLQAMYAEALAACQNNA